MALEEYLILGVRRYVIHVIFMKMSKVDLADLVINENFPELSWEEAARAEEMRLK